MNKFILKGSIALLPLLLLVFACTDDKLQTGIEILPESDQLEAKADTLSIECYTYKGLIGNAYGTSTSTYNYPIGQVFDDIFGETVVDAAMEFSYNTDDHYTYDTAYPVDNAISLKLYLNTTDLDFYGTDGEFDVDIFLLNSQYTYTGNTSQSVPSNYFDAYNSRTDSTKHNITINSTDIPQLDSSNTYIIIELDTALANILTDTIYNTTDFYEALPGMLLRANTDDYTIGALQNFTPLNSKLILEYERKGIAYDGGDSTYYSSFDISKFQFNYRNNHTGRDAEIETVFRDTINQSNKFYLQGLGGTRGIIKFNSIIDFKKEYGSTIGINLAELVLPINEESIEDTLKFKLPLRISAQGLAPNLIMLPDDQISAYYFNGYLDKENLVYRINLSEYVSKYMLEDLDYILLNITTAEYNSATNSIRDYSTPSRVVLNSGLDGIIDKAFIRVIYTLIYE